MATKRVILANNSRLLREMLHHVINKADNLEVVLETPNDEELSSAIEKFDPAWVIASLPANPQLPSWLNRCTEHYPAVRFILLTPNNDRIKMSGQASYEEDLTNVSLKDFIDILEIDLQHT
jgi:DNA-binding NarL/FixJ family response regulator